jgi:hypothetical protein
MQLMVQQTAVARQRTKSAGLATECRQHWISFITPRGVVQGWDKREYKQMAVNDSYIPSLPECSAHKSNDPLEI